MTYYSPIGDGYSYDNRVAQKLVGRKVLNVWMNDELLVFDTDQGLLAYAVEGDCCSHSYFYDFIGVLKLLNNGPVLSVKALDVKEINESNEYDYIQAYGFEIVTEHHVWGEQTSVFSFRNSSNGYYGGWMFEIEPPTDSSAALLTSDVISTDSL